MVTKRTLCTGFVVLALAVCCFSGKALAKIEWNELSQIDLEETPLDMAISKDGLTSYILCADKILLYSTQEKRITDTIPVKGRFSGIALSPDGETLFLTNAEKKAITLIQVTPIFDIKTGQSPVIGNPNARVSIYAFLDFQ